MFPLLTIDVAQTLIAQVSLGCSNPNWVQIIALIPLILLVFVLVAAIIFTVAVIVSSFVMGLNFIQYIFAGLAAFFTANTYRKLDGIRGFDGSYGASSEMYQHAFRM